MSRLRGEEGVEVVFVARMMRSSVLSGDFQTPKFALTER